MCQGQASLTELSFSSASSVVTKPLVGNDILMVKQTNKQASDIIAPWFLWVFFRSDLQCFITFEYWHPSSLTHLGDPLEKRKLTGGLIKLWAVQTFSVAADLLEKLSSVPGTLHHWHMASRGVRTPLLLTDPFGVFQGTNPPRGWVAWLCSNLFTHLFIFLYALLVYLLFLNNIHEVFHGDVNSK